MKFIRCVVVREDGSVKGFWRCFKSGKRERGFVVLGFRMGDFKVDFVKWGIG